MFPGLLVLILAANSASIPSPVKRVVPNFRDLTIKRRITEGVGSPREMDLFLKGARSRIENRLPIRMPSIPLLNNVPSTNDPLTFMSGSISQCDLRTHYLLRPPFKTYIKQTDPEREREPDEISPLARMSERHPDGPNVNVTVETIDTGERRQMGSYEARRVTTTITVAPGRKARTRPARVEIDGLYLDLQGMSCLERSTPEQPPALTKMVLKIVRNGDHPTIKELGTARRGFPAEEKSTRKQDENVIVDKVELLEFSEQTLDPSLFEPPADYTQQAPGQHPVPGERLNLKNRQR